MRKRLMLTQLTILAAALMSLPAAKAQTITGPDRIPNKRIIIAPFSMPISTYDQDPFLRESMILRMPPSRFEHGVDGRPILTNDRVSLIKESKIYRKDVDGEYKPFAWNPWPYATSNTDGDFRFQDEERFPLFKQERDSNGKVILIDGLQLWSPNNLHLGMTTTFNAANTVIDAGEFWAGRKLSWGVNGLLEIETQTFIDFNAFYSPSAKMLFFGVVPYRLKGETNIKILETATCWELAAHESGHALHHALKPNVDQADHGYNIWGEFFGDQTAIWATLKNPDRVSRLIAETDGDFNQPNSLSSLVEAFAVLVGSGTGIRDAFNDKKISDTEDEVHDRSEVLTGAVYKLFLAVYSRVKSERGCNEQEALTEAGDIMGSFLTRSTDYTPENRMTLEDVAKAYLKVDKEFYGGCYRDMMVDEFIRREIFDADSLNEWMAHEATTPYLRLSGLPRRKFDSYVEELIQANLDRLGIGPDFGLKLQSVTQDERFGQAIVRVQLTMGRGDDATLLNNHGILVFRRNGTLADYHSPLPATTSTQDQAQVFRTEELRPLIVQARKLSLNHGDAPPSIVRGSDGRFSVETRVIRGDGINAHMEVFTPDNPRGARREIIIPPMPPDKRIPIPDDIIN